MSIYEPQVSISNRNVYVYIYVYIILYYLPKRLYEKKLYRKVYPKSHRKVYTKSLTENLYEKPISNRKSLYLIEKSIRNVYIGTEKSISKSIRKAEKSI